MKLNIDSIRREDAGFGNGNGNGDGSGYGGGIRLADGYGDGSGYGYRDVCSIIPEYLYEKLKDKTAQQLLAIKRGYEI